MAQGFVSLHRGEQDMAARAAVALIVRRAQRKGQPVNNRLVGSIAHQVLTGLYAFPASSGYRWECYAKAVKVNDNEQVSNRRWMQYSSEVRAAAWELADHIQTLMESPFPIND